MCLRKKLLSIPEALEARRPYGRDQKWRRYQGFTKCITVNPIPAGVLENQHMLGGGQFDPPSKSHVLCPNMTNDTSLESSCALLIESAKKIANLQKLNFLSQNPVM